MIKLCAIYGKTGTFMQWHEILNVMIWMVSSNKGTNFDFEIIISEIWHEWF